jgi:hypothetical protein
MKCNEIKEFFYDFSRSRLDAGAMDAVKEHLDSCGACLSEYKVLLKINGLFKESIENPPVSIKRNIDRALRAEKGGIFGFLRPAAVLSAAVSAIILVFIAGFLLRYNRQKQVSDFLNDTYEIYSSQDEASSASIIATDYMDDIDINN